MIRFLTSAASWGVALITGRCLLVGGAYFDLSVNAFNRGRRLFVSIKPLTPGVDRKVKNP